MPGTVTNTPSEPAALSAIEERWQAFRQDARLDAFLNTTEISICRLAFYAGVTSLLSRLVGAGGAVISIARVMADTELGLAAHTAVERAHLERRPMEPRR